MITNIASTILMRNNANETYRDLKDGFTYKIRPIQQNDREQLIQLFDSLSPESRYLRFAHAISKLPDQFLEDVLELDYQKELAVVAVIENNESNEEIIGISRYVSDPSGNTCEFSISVSDLYTAHGIGMNLMKQLIAHARRNNLQKMIGYILSGNTKMLQMTRELGFQIEASANAPEFKIATLELQSE